MSDVDHNLGISCALHMAEVVTVRKCLTYWLEKQQAWENANSGCNYFFIFFLNVIRETLHMLALSLSAICQFPTLNNS